ncbi:homoserine O-succinyltransferase MetX [Arenimonas fontis]|uniref:homoserine O-succinyltransferase MetX n=1 Tax=Arenimonas fontis TaxID=2608255 RepID=UPI003CCC7517
MSLHPSAEPAEPPVPASGDVPSRRFSLALRLPLRHAGPRQVVLRGQCLGRPGAPWLVVAGGISAGRHLAAHAGDPSPGWWQAQVGPGKAVDTLRWRVLSLDWLGADGALDVPLDSADQADAVAAALDALAAPRIRAFIGASYGAMVGLQFAARHGPRLGELVAISGAHRPHPYASAWRALQRRVLALGRDQAAAGQALSLARQLAMLAYRTPEEFAERFDRPPVIREGRARVAAEAYLQARGDAYAARFPSTAFLRLSESIDLHRVDPREVRVPVTVVGVQQDRLVPLSDLQALVEALPGPARLQVLRSRYGHDAFLKEDAAISAVLARALSGEAKA